MWKVAKANISDSAIEAELVAAAEKELTGAREDESEPKKKTKKKVFEGGKLPRRIQQRGTVQKNIFEWTNKVAGDTWRLALTAKASTTSSPTPSALLSLQRSGTGRVATAHL